MVLPWKQLFLLSFIGCLGGFCIWTRECGFRDRCLAKWASKDDPSEEQDLMIDSIDACRSEGGEAICYF